MELGTILAFLGLVVPAVLFFLAHKSGKEITGFGALVLVMIFGWSGFKLAVHYDILPHSKAFAAVALEHVDISTGVAASGESRSMVQTQGTIKASSSETLRADIYGWNSQMGWIYANGGPTTKSGSLMAKHGVSLLLNRNDSNNAMQTDAMNFAREYKKGNKHPSTGAHIIAMMGDGTAPFLYAMNKQIKSEAGWEYRYIIIGTSGQSYGEDKAVIPADMVKDPSAARPELKDINLMKGEVFVAVAQDGDANIFIKWAADNGICFNADPSRLDLECINIEPAKDNNYMEAAYALVNGLTVKREEYRNGKPTGRGLVTKKVRMAATWTPGDEYIFSHMDNVVSLADTLLYSGQMPQAIMVCNKWAKDNPEVVQALLSAIYEGGDAVLRDKKALSEAARASAVVYKEKDGKYWESMYNGLVTYGSQGNYFRLGGSRAYNLADAFREFGLEPGRENLFKATYTTFGKAISQLYPGDVPEIYPFEDVSDLSYLKALEGHVAAGVVQTETTTSVVPGSRARVGGRPVEINFQFRLAKFAPGAESQLEELKQQLAICGGCSIELNGYTDSTGSRQFNMNLSQDRADAVKAFLRKEAPGNFPDSKVKSQGFGPDNPKYSNNTDDGRAKNRRVEVVLYSAQ